LRRLCGDTRKTKRKDNAETQRTQSQRREKNGREEKRREEKRREEKRREEKRREKNGTETDGCGKTEILFDDPDLLHKRVAAYWAYVFDDRLRHDSAVQADARV
jgi:hypothetical protein